MHQRAMSRERSPSGLFLLLPALKSFASMRFERVLEETPGPGSEAAETLVSGGAVL